MSGTIVVGYDGSPGAQAALDVAMDLGKDLGALVVAVFCYEPPAVRAGGAAGDQRDVVENIGGDWLAEAVERGRARGLAIEGELVDGRPAAGLLAVADARDARMVVVGHHGEGPLVGALLGATSPKVVSRSARPVLVVPHPTT